MAKEMKQPARVARDIERDAIDEALLPNTAIRSLAWHGIAVGKRSWMTDARPIPILSKIDGFAEAGTLTHKSENPFALKQFRDTHRPDGTFWQRQNHATECACSSKSRSQIEFRR